MHTAYCHRNLKLCLKCDEPFLTSEFEEHQKTMHADIFCDACTEKLEAIDLELHKVIHFIFFIFQILVFIFVIPFRYMIVHIVWLLVTFVKLISKLHYCLHTQMCVVVVQNVVMIVVNLSCSNSLLFIRKAINLKKFPMVRHMFCTI